MSEFADNQAFEQNLVGAAIMRRMVAAGTVIAASLGIVGHAEAAEKIPANSSVCITPVEANPGDTVALNVISVEADGPGYTAGRASDDIAVYKRPASERYSTGNFTQGSTDPNLTFVEVGTDGKVCFDNSVSAAHLVVDQFGTFPAGAYQAVDPIRLEDTRGEPVEPGQEGIEIISQSGPKPLELDQLDLNCGYKIASGMNFAREEYEFLFTGLSAYANLQGPVDGGDEVLVEWTRRYPDGQTTTAFTNGYANSEGIASVSGSGTHTWVEAVKEIKLDSMVITRRPHNEPSSVTVISGVVTCTPIP